MTLPVLATLTVIGAGLAVSVFAPVAHAKPCPPPLCANADACKSSADWVVEGRVLEFIEGGYDRTCHTTYPFLSQVCVSPTEPPTVLLDHAVEVRGRADLVAQGTATLPQQATCPLVIATQIGPIQPYDPGSAMVGKQYRFYGFNPRPGSNASAVYVIAEAAVGAMLPR